QLWTALALNLPPSPQQKTMPTFASPSVKKMITVLRRTLKSRSLRYREVAERLGMSESSIKRHLTGQGVTLNGLERLAAVVDLDLLSLAVLATQESDNSF